MSAEFDPLITAWADDLFLHGVHLARWITDYVDLEESLAVGTLAQEQLAHARGLLTEAGLTPTERDSWLYDRPVSDWAPSRLAADPIEHWPQVVAVGLLLTHATLSLLAEAFPTLEVCPDENESAAWVAGIAAEQRLHLMHWQRWTVLLAGSAATREGFLDTLRWAGELAGDLFGDHQDANGPTTSHAEQASPGLPTAIEQGWQARARARFAADLAASLTEAGLSGWSFDVDRPRRAGEHAALIAPVLAEQQVVRRRYPDPVLEPQ